MALDPVYTSDPPLYELWDGTVDPSSGHPDLVVLPKIYTQRITQIIGLFVLARTTENAEAFYSLLVGIDVYFYFAGWPALRFDFDAATGEQIGLARNIPIPLVNGRVSQSPNGQLYNNDGGTAVTFPLDPDTLLASGSGYDWDYWHDGATYGNTVYAIMIDPLAGLAVIKTNLNTNTEVSVHQLSDGDTVRRIGVAGMVHSIAAESPGTCYVVATNGVISVVDYINGQILGVFRMTGQASFFNFAIAWDPVYRRALLCEVEDDAADGAATSTIRGYRPVPVPLALTPPLPIRTPRLGRTVPVIVRAYGDAGEGVSGIRIAETETGSGTLLSAAEPTDELGYATVQERCDATGTSLVEASTTV